MARTAVYIAMLAEGAAGACALSDMTSVEHLTEIRQIRQNIAGCSRRAFPRGATSETSCRMTSHMWVTRAEDEYTLYSD